MSDHDVIILAMNKDEKSFQELYMRYHKLAFFIALKICGNEADAQDVVQESFIAVQKNLSSLQNPDAFKGWLARIVVTKCKRLFRKNHQVNRYLENMNEEDAVFEVRRDFNPTKHQHFQNDKEVLTDLLNELSIEQRTMIVLFYFQELSLHEIADTTGLPLGTVKSRLSYARKKLYTKIQAYERENQERLSFQAFDAILLGLFAKSYAIFVLPNTIAPVLKAKRIRNNLHLPKGFAMTCAIGTVTTLGLTAIPIIQNLQHPPLQAMEETKVFHEVQLQKTKITNPKDAFFSLIMWSYDAEELASKHQQEISEYQPLYDELKQYGGYYYDLLYENHWQNEYENLN